MGTSVLDSWLMMIFVAPLAEETDEGSGIFLPAHWNSPLLLAGLEVHFVDEGIVALGRGAGAGEVDHVLVLQDDAVPVLEVMTGRPGVVVGVLGVEVEDLLRGDLGLVDVRRARSSASAFSQFVSEAKAMPGVANQVNPAKRFWVLKTSFGSPVKGAGRTMTLSRKGTSFSGFAVVQRLDPDRAWPA